MAARLRFVAVSLLASTVALGSARAHDPAAPASSIDCPLAKAGIRHGDLRPFKDVEKYIAFLERPDRARWQKPDAVVAAMALAGDETLVDVGAGSGYFTFRFARALPRGKVVATDIAPEMVRHIHHKAMSEKVANVQAVVGQPDDPGIPEDANVVFVCDVLHHVPAPAAWLGKLASQIKSGTRVAIIEFKPGKLPQGPPEKLKIPRKKLLAMATEAGLVLDVEKPKLLPYQTFTVFRKP